MCISKSFDWLLFSNMRIAIQRGRRLSCFLFSLPCNSQERKEKTKKKKKPDSLVKVSPSRDSELFIVPFGRQTDVSI